MIRSLARYHPAMLGACLVAAAAVACTDNPPTAPTPRNAVFAKGSGGAGPKVSSTDPNSGARNATLVVRVLGSGYGQGTRAVWALKGDTTFAVTKVKTNSTTFVSSTELVANITIQGEASLALYDVVAVTADGKKGIGIEIFTVTAVAITDLGTLGGNTSIAVALNTPSVGNRLLMVGHSQDRAGTQHAAFWYVDMASGARQAGALPAPTGDVKSFASGVNQSEGIVGSSANTVGGSSVPVRWAPGGWSPSFLNLNGGTIGNAYNINVAGQIIGLAGTPYELHAIVWEGDIRTDLSTFGGNVSQGLDVNAAGVVVGASRYLGSSNDRAFVWAKPGPMIQLPDAGHQSFASAINDAGVIVGWVWSPNGTRAVRWLPPATIGGSYTMEDLGLFNSFAYDINNAGEIVGQYQPGSDIQGFYWIDGRTKNLPGLTLPAGAGARAINENGDIAGWSNSQNQYQRAVLWTHVR